MRQIFKFFHHKITTVLCELLLKKKKNTTVLRRRTTAVKALSLTVSLLQTGSADSPKLLSSLLLYSSSCGCGNNVLESSLRYVHSCRQFKRDKPSTVFQRKNNKKCINSTNNKEEDNVDKKRAVYMRETISKIHNTLKYSTWDRARDELQNAQIKWDSFTVNQVLKTHPPMEKAWLFFNWAAGVKGFKHDQFTYTTMLDIFGEAGRVSSMRHVFGQMVEKGIKVDAVACTSLMHWVSESGDVDGAVRVWEEMKKASGCRPTVVSYTAYMKILFRYNRVKEAADVYKEMLRSGLSPNCHTYTVLMEYLVESGKCKEALEIFDKMQEAKVQPDKAACNILVEKLSKSGETQAMSQVLHYTKANHIVLRYPVFLKALDALKAAGDSDILLRQVNRHCSIEDSTRTAQADKHLTVDEELILTLMKKENLLAADGLLARIANKNIKLDPEIISMIIEVNCDRCRLEQALWVFEYSVKTGTGIPKSSYLALLGALIRSNLFSKVTEVVEEMIKAQHSVGIYLASILIRKLGRAGKPKFAARVFKLLPLDHQCSATCTALIGAYFSVGNFDKGLEVFRAMQTKGIVPTLGTYDLLLDGLSRSGRVSELGVLRKEKRKLQADHGLSQDIIPFQEKICDLLFVRDMIVY